MTIIEIKKHDDYQINVRNKRTRNARKSTAGSDFCDLFQQPNVSAKEQDVLAVELTKDLTDLFIKYKKLLPSDNTRVITKSINDALNNIKKYEYDSAWPFYS